MRFLLLPTLALLVINFGVDVSLYRFLKRECLRSWPRLIQKWTAVLLSLWLLVIILMPKRAGSDTGMSVLMWGLLAYFSIYIPKYIFIICDLIGSIPRIWHGKRMAGFSWGGLILGTVVFVIMWWGALVNRYNLQLTKVDVEIPGLPAAFNGYRIVQLSDMHVGTFGGDTTFVSEIVDSVNALRPDIVVFTGDAVNRRSEEFIPFIQVLSRIKAPVYSIMGNHDYGDYSEWPSEAAHLADADSLKAMEKAAGWHMLNNQHVWLHAGGDSIALIGVENIGDPPFKVYGKLDKAYPDVKDDKTKILLSHSPAHYQSDIEGKDNNIALTLSGHTHAMQIRLFGISPAVLRYKLWGGLYDDGRGHKLYINIGCGTVGIPMRVGANPELTVITLRQ